MDVLLISNADRPFYINQCKALRKAGVNITRMNIPRSNDRLESRSIWDYTRFLPSMLKRSITDDFDIVHANFGITAPYALLQPHMNSVITFWGSDLMADNYYSTVNSNMANHFDSVILPSKAMSDYVDCDHYIVPFGIDTNQFRPIDREKARKKVGWDHAKNIVLFPYSPTRDEKNYDLAESVVSNIHKDIELKTIYDVDYEDVPYYMNASNVVLITSKRESGPLVVKEAASCNVPVVSTDVGFVSDVLNGIQNSAVEQTQYQLTTSLEAILETDCRSNGRKQANEWSLDHMGRQLVDVYESTVTK